MESERLQLLKEILGFAQSKKKRLYLVGGYLRDLLLKRDKPNPDIDFCLEKNAIAFGRNLAHKLHAGFVVLDKEHGCCRLVKRVKEKTYTLDFADFRGKDLKTDLLLRDFSINALALDLADFLTGKKFPQGLIDPFDGQKDLKLKRISFIHASVFDQDPLRILRAFSLSAIFGFKITPQTLKLIKAKKEKLSTVSFERVRDELFKILGQPNAYEYLVLLDQLKILKIILPEIELMRGVNQGPYHHLDVLGHSFESLKKLEEIVEEHKHNPDIKNFLSQQISAERSRLELLKLGVFLHDIGKPQAKRRKGNKTIFHGHERVGAHIARNIARRLKLSNDELEAISKIVFWHLRPGYLADSSRPSARAKFRYFRDAGNEAISVLLASLADQRATRGRLTTQESRQQHEKVVAALIREYFKQQKEKKFPRLINGDDLIKSLKLDPSPLIGKILQEIEELQAIGKIKTKKEALEKAKKIIRRQ
ncbi:MAG: HD domain-containing protein [Candidatus Omnitrophica bacterium]|nr:HD domain-containing protein [Candidatus Omnitrophota bacterium]